MKGGKYQNLVKHQNINRTNNFGLVVDVKEIVKELEKKGIP